MKRIALFTAVFASLFAFAFAFIARPAAAQDEMMTHTCDSTLITLLYIAESEYGFHSMMDLATFDKGQYAELFDAMMMEMDDAGMMEMTEEPMMDTTDEAMMEATDEAMMDDMMMLPVGNIEGEDPACTQLRAELDSFFYGQFTMMEEGM